MRTLPSVTFTCIIHFLLGLKPAVGAFFITTFTLMVAAYSASSMAPVLAAGPSVVSTATLFTIMYL